MELVEEKKVRSPVWVFYGFKPLEDGSIDETSPICRICEASIAVKFGNTSNLFSQLKCKHPRQYADIQNTRSASKAGQSSQRSSSQPSLQQTLDFDEYFRSRG